MKVSKALFQILEGAGLAKLKKNSIYLHAKEISFVDHLKLVIALIIMRCKGLRDIERIPNRDNTLPTISISQLSKLNNNKDYRTFVLTFYNLLCHRRYFRRFGVHRKYIGKLLGVDSTTIKVNQPLKLPNSAQLSDKEAKSIKIHLAALLGAMVQPLSAIVTPGNVHDTRIFDSLIQDVSAVEELRELIIIMDKGYYDSKRFKKLIDNNIKFVIQLKKNVKYASLSSVLYDNYIEERILIDGYEFRLIKYNDDREWMFITNIRENELSGDDIREIYRTRWMIEIFFRELKREFCIEHLFSKSVNGVMIQIYSTLIAYILINIYRAKNGLLYYSMETIIRYVRVNFNVDEKIANQKMKKCSIG